MKTKTIAELADIRKPDTKREDLGETTSHDREYLAEIGRERSDQESFGVPELEKQPLI